jgi:predicted transcriptional regulator
MSFCTTVLGRSVSIDDWKAYQGDVVLKILYDYHSSMSNEHGSDYVLTITDLVNGSALGAHEASEVCDHLRSLGFVAIDQHAVRITDAGVRFVSETIDANHCPTCGR